MENAGKVLTVGSDGNVTPGEVTGGEVWEEVDLSNWPTDWVVGERVRISILVEPYVTNVSSWTQTISSSNIAEYYNLSPIVTEFCLQNANAGPRAPVYFNTSDFSFISFITITTIYSVNEFNQGNIVELSIGAFNGARNYGKTYLITKQYNQAYIKIWRLKH